MAIISGTSGADSITGAGSSGGLPILSAFDADVVFGNDGNDTITANPANAAPAFYFGGNGNDQITGGGSNSALRGDSGDDTLVAGLNGFSQLLDGGSGADSLVAGNFAALLMGGDGNDTITGSGSFDTIDGGNGNNSILGGAGGDVILAGFNNDSLSGEAGFDTIDGGNGNNFISGGLDSDLLTGGSGNDTIQGDEGNDTINGGGGGTTVSGSLANVLSGGDGDDSITAGFGADSIDGGSGNDRIDAGDGNNSVHGGSGNDIIFAGFGADTIDGGDGDDQIRDLGGSAIIIGGAGNDNIVASAGNDSIDGQNGNDRIDAGDGNNTLTGGLGNDRIFAGSGADSILGEDGNDSIVADGGADILLGGIGNDTLDGGDGSDTLDGGAGNDRILAGGSNDIIIASIGDDLIDGGDGFDVLDYSQLGVTASVVVTLSLGFFRAAKRDGGVLTGSDFLSNSVERFIGTQNADKFLGWDQDETFTGGAGNDTIDGGGGFDTARYDVVGVGSVVANLLTGIVHDGLGGIDRLSRASATNNFIESIVTGDADDTIIGDSDGNFLRGRGGADFLDGGAGLDTADYSGDAAFGSTLSGVLANLSADTVGGVAGGQARDSSNSIDTLVNIENLRGTDLADTLIGNDADGNSFRAGRGADVIDGRLGTDIADHRNDSDLNSDGFGAIINLSNGAVTIAGFGAETNIVVGGLRARDGWGDIDTLTSIESAAGTSAHDLIIGAERTPSFSFGGIEHFATDRSFLRGRQGNDTIEAVEMSDGVVASYGDDQSGIIARLDLGNIIEDGFGYFDTLVNVDNVQGSSFDDVIAAATTGTWMRGRGGDDTLTGGAGFDTANYGSAATAVNVNLLTGVAQDGDGGTDSLAGSIELISGSAFADVLVGDADGTWFFGGEGADSIVGGAGEDWVTYYSGWIGVVSAVHNGVNVNLNNQTVRDGDGTPGGGSLDKLISIEHAVGTHAADTLIGSAGANSLAGAEGDDTINALAGNDVLDGGAGDDTLQGGDGADTMIGGAGNDFFFVGVAADIVIEAAAGGADTVQSAVSYALAVGTEIEVLLLTGASNLFGTGNAFANALLGNTGANRLTGDAGNDTLSGGLGADSLFGGLGADSLSGGGGADKFQIDRLADSRGTTAIDRIAGFEIGLDDLIFQDVAGRFVAGVATTAINLNAAQTIATAANLAAVYAGISALAASNATLQMAQINVTGGAAGGSYLYVNDGNAGVNNAADMLIAISFTGGPTLLTAGDLGLF